MDKYEAVLKLLVEAIQNNQGKEVIEPKMFEIPVGVSNRHAHLSQEDLDILFGKGYNLTKIKDLSQPGQYACKETITICGPKGAIEKVRILGPIRSKTQVEVLAGDCVKLGTAAYPRLSGDLANTPGVTLVGPKGATQIKEGLIVAQRHIHMTPKDAEKFNVCDKEIVEAKVMGQRPLTFDDVVIRVSDSFKTYMHIDYDEANACGYSKGTVAKIIKKA